MRRLAPCPASCLLRVNTQIRQLLRLIRDCVNTAITGLSALISLKAKVRDWEAGIRCAGLSAVS